MIVVSNVISFIKTRFTMPLKLSWGIAGAGKICNDFVAALKTLSSNNHVVTAVASRSLANAETFAMHFDIPQYFEGYNCLADNEEINVVYVGVINTEHYSVARNMLEKGKHVLVEKPMCMNHEETLRLIKIAQENKCFLMEAMWSRCFPIYKELRSLVEGNAIGEVCQVSAHFGFPLTNVERVTSRRLGGGVMHDLGVYVLQFAQFVFRGLSPIEIRALGETNEDGVDICTGVLLKYPGGKSAVLSVNSQCNMSNTAEIMGTNGYMTVPKFWCPTEIIFPNGKKNFALPDTEYRLNFVNSTGLAYEAEEVRRSIEKGLLQSVDMSWKESLELVQWRDEILSQINAC